MISTETMANRSCDTDNKVEEYKGALWRRNSICLLCNKKINVQDDVEKHFTWDRNHWSKFQEEAKYVNETIHVYDQGTGLTIADRF